MSYYSPNPANAFPGGSVSASTDFSSDRNSVNSETVNQQLTVQGTAVFSGQTTFNGNVDFAGTATISGLTVSNAGAIVAATGITSSGAIQFSDLNTANGLLYADGTGVVAQTAQGAAGTVLHGNGSSAPTFSAVLLASDVSGVLPVTNGGAGSVSGLLKADGTGLVSAAVSGTDYQAPLIFSGNLINTSGTISDALISGKSGGQTIIGGQGTSDALTIQGTSGIGAAGTAAINLNVGNNGSTNAVTILNNGNVGIGTANPTSLLFVNGNATFYRHYCPGNCHGNHL